MSEPDAVPLPRAGEVFFDVRGEARSMRLSWYADSAIAVFSIWQGNRCTGTFRLPFGDLARMVETLQAGPQPQANGRSAAGAFGDVPSRAPAAQPFDLMDGYGLGGIDSMDPTAAYGPAGSRTGESGFAVAESDLGSGDYGLADYGLGEYGAGAGNVSAGGLTPGDSAMVTPPAYGPGGHNAVPPEASEVDEPPYGTPAGYGAAGYGAVDYPSADYGAADYRAADYGLAVRGEMADDPASAAYDDGRSSVFRMGRHSRDASRGEGRNDSDSWAFDPEQRIGAREDQAVPEETGAPGGWIPAPTFGERQERGEETVTRGFPSVPARNGLPG